MKTIVIYKSKTGFAKQYAEWIAAELQADLFEVAKVNLDMLLGYETIIYGGGLYALGINGVKLITKNLAKLKAKKVVVFATGASPVRTAIVDEIRNKNFSLEQQQYLKFFYLRGGFDYNNLKPLDKFLMQLLKWQLKRKPRLTPDEQGMLAAYEQPVDFRRQKNLAELIAYIKGNG